MTGVLIRKGNVDRDIHRQGTPHEHEETGMIHLQAKEHQGLPVNNKKLGERHGKDSPSQVSEGNNPTHPWRPCTSIPQNCEIIHFCYYKLPRV